MTTENINLIAKWLLVFGLLGAALFFATHKGASYEGYASGCAAGAAVVFIWGILLE